MVLHPVKLPPSATLLFRIVALQKRLLKALADPNLNGSSVDTAWVQRLWSRLDVEWVRRFCLGGQEAHIRAIAQAPAESRRALYLEFCRQRKVKVLWLGNGDFQGTTQLPSFDAQLSEHVACLFKNFYKLLSVDRNRKWNGYEFGRTRVISNRLYKEEFCANYPVKVVCPYCDGDIGTPQLDHYLSKDMFPLVSCSPWNLIPICGSCNDVVTAKGSRPALNLGTPNSTQNWLHPFARPASAQVHIKLSGPPQNSIPELHSTDATENASLFNRAKLIQTLSKRWTNKAASYHDRLVREVNKKLKGRIIDDLIVNKIDELVVDELAMHLDDRGQFPSSMIYASVCQAILDRRPEYLEEFAFPNPPMLL